MISDIGGVGIHHMANHTSAKKNLTAGDKDVETISTRQNQQCIAKPSAVLCRKYGEQMFE